jgi:hypothetical protein
VEVLDFQAALAQITLLIVQATVVPVVAVVQAALVATVLQHSVKMIQWQAQVVQVLPAI